MEQSFRCAVPRTLAGLLFAPILLLGSSVAAQELSLIAGSGDETTGVTMKVKLTRDAQSDAVKTFFRADNGRTARRTPISTVAPLGADRCTLNAENSDAVAQRGHFEYTS
ncbi:MAG: hypothetical protein OXF79_00940, partial [Chloroflexi bacterium]|nr:hypothetical protein [Chloroflexota bacterium]